MDAIQLGYLLGGMFAGGLGGIVAYRSRMKQVMNKSWPFLYGDATLVLYDVTTDTIEPFAVEKVTETVYMSPDGSLFLVIPPTVRPSFSHTLRRPIFLAVGGKASAIAMNPDILGKIGVASVSIESKYWNMTNKEAIYRLIEELYQLGAEKTGKIPVTSDVRLAFAIKTPDIIKSIVSIHAERGRAIHRALLEVMQSVREIQELQLKMEQARAVRRFGWILYIVIAIMMIGITLAILKAVGFFGGG